MDAFISPRTRNDVIPGLTSEKIASTEAGYLMKSGRLPGKSSLLLHFFQRSGSEHQFL
jgi:hypothetical protein